MDKVKVIFVGSFIEKAKDGSVGGQMFACKSIINSNLNSFIDWILLDTTGVSVPPPSLYLRGLSAILRLIKFIYLIVKFRPKFTLIFTASGASFIEKGLMVLISKTFFVKCILAPRAGALKNHAEKNYLFFLFLKIVIKSTNYVICQGRFMQTFLAKIIPNKTNKLLIINNWINSSLYQINWDRAIFINANLNNKVITILYMGWVQADKGIFDLYNALLVPSIKSMKIKILILGNGPALNKLKEMVKKENNINHSFEFPGWVYGDQKIQYIHKSDIFILPSYSEGMPNSLMEAMASGLPSIATNVGAVSDLIIDNITGLLVRPNNPIEISKSILKYINNPDFARAISFSAVKHIKENHSLSRAEHTFKNIFNNK